MGRFCLWSAFAVLLLAVVVEGGRVGLLVQIIASISIAILLIHAVSLLGSVRAVAFF